MLGARLHAHRILGACLVEDVERADATLRAAPHFARPARGHVPRLHPVMHHRAVELERARDVGLAANGRGQLLGAIHPQILGRKTEFDNATFWISRWRTIVRMEFDKTMPIRPPKPGAAKEQTKDPHPAKDEPTVPLAKEQQPKVQPSAKEQPASPKPAAPATKERPAAAKPAAPVAKEQSAPPPPAPAPASDPFKPRTAADAWLGLLPSRGVADPSP